MIVNIFHQTILLFTQIQVVNEEEISTYENLGLIGNFSVMIALIFIPTQQTIQLRIQPMFQLPRHHLREEEKVDAKNN